MKAIIKHVYENYFWQLFTAAFIMATLTLCAIQSCNMKTVDLLEPISGCMLWSIIGCSLCAVSDDE